MNRSFLFTVLVVITGITDPAFALKEPLDKHELITLTDNVVSGTIIATNQGRHFNFTIHQVYYGNLTTGTTILVVNPTSCMGVPGFDVGLDFLLCLEKPNRSKTASDPEVYHIVWDDILGSYYFPKPGDKPMSPVHSKDFPVEDLLHAIARKSTIQNAAHSVMQTMNLASRKELMEKRTEILKKLPTDLIRNPWDEAVVDAAICEAGTKLSGSES